MLRKQPGKTQQERKLKRLLDCKSSDGKQKKLRYKKNSKEKQKRQLRKKLLDNKSSEKKQKKQLD